MDIETRVRQNTTSAAIAAGLLIFVGFFMETVAVGSPFYLTAVAAFDLTLKVGGLAMIGIAVWSAVGHGPALLADAIISCTIGVLLVATGLAMTIAGGDIIQLLINGVCGMVFVTSGLRNGRDYYQFAPSRGQPAIGTVEDSGRQSKQDFDEPSLLDAPRSDPARGDVDVDRVKTAAPKPKKIHHRQTSGRFGASEEAIHLTDAPSPPPKPETPPPEGFLADLADDDRQIR